MQGKTYRTELKQSLPEVLNLQARTQGGNFPFERKKSMSSLHMKELAPGLLQV